MAGSANPAAVAPQVNPIRPTPAAPTTFAQPTQPNVFGQAANALTGGINAANSVAGYRPTNVSAPKAITAQNVTAGQLSNTNLNPYLNPFTQNVIDTSMGALDRARQMTMNDVGAQATAANAFGGSRHGIVEAETNRGFADQAGQMASQLNMQNFMNAQQMGQFDIGSRLQAGLANQGANLQAQQSTAANALQAQIANQQAAAQAAQARLSAASTLGNLSQTGFNMGMGISQQQAQQGAMQQGAMQALIDAAKGQYGGFTGAPMQALQMPMAAVGAANMGQQTQTTSNKPGLFNYLMLPFMGG